MDFNKIWRKKLQEIQWTLQSTAYFSNYLKMAKKIKFLQSFKVNLKYKLKVIRGLKIQSLIPAATFTQFLVLNNIIIR